MRRIRIFCLAVLLGVVGAASPEDARKGKSSAGADRLLGTYEIVSGERFGVKLPADKVRGARVLIEKGSITTTDKEGKHLYAATYEVDTGTTPWVIVMTSTAPQKGDTARGVIAADSDTVKLCYALPGTDRPTEFKTKEGQLLFVLKRVPARAPSK